MKKLALFALVLLSAGCATHGGGGNSGGSYSGPPEWRDRIRNHLNLECERVGHKGDGAKFSVYAKRCPPTDHNQDGDYVCGGDCSGVKECVHAWNMTGAGSWTTSFMFAGEPNDWVIAHEVGHTILMHYAGAGGHPATVTIDGKRYDVKRDIIGGARWPSLVRALKFWDDWEPGDTLGDAQLDEKGVVRFVEPVPEKLTDGAGI